MSSEIVQITLTALLLIVFVCVLLLPFLVKRIEKDLELFLFCMGFTAITLDTVIGLLFPDGAGGEVPSLDLELIGDSLKDPLLIAGAVLIAGFAFHYLRGGIARSMDRVRKRFDRRLLVFLTIVVLGLISSIISAIIASLLLAEIVTHLRIERRKAIPVVVIACFSIGMGAALTPLGEPLSAIVVSKLHERIDYLAILLWPFVLPGILALGLLGAYVVGRPDHGIDIVREARHHGSIKEVIFRAIKVYMFVMALVFLGAGLNPLIEWYVLDLSPLVLYWVNIASAVLDNATLAAAEFHVPMARDQILGALLAMLIAGGMLIPGNIPNIISSSKMRIKSMEWARVGIPLGIVMMVIYFIIFLIVQM